jgi:acid phosphatase (class A)
VKHPESTKNRARRVLAAVCLFLISSHLLAQETDARKKRSPLFFDPTLLNVSLILAPPPADNTARGKADFDEVRALERSRTSEQIALAQADDKEEDIFIFHTLLGAAFKAENLPITAALSAHIRNDSELVDPPLKHLYKRPRPYMFDKRLHPVCQLSGEPSYPSGHAMLGYLFAFTLAQILPERYAEIQRRGDDYAENRLICGVHYRSDLEASRLASATLFGYMLASPHFQRELEDSRQEIRRYFGLPLQVDSQP